MADGAVNFLLDKLTIILSQNASALGDCEDLIDEAKLELELIRSFITDAERRKEKSDQVETWVRQVREVSYEAEETIDEFLYHKCRRQRLKQFKVVTNLPSDMISRYNISTRLKKIKQKIIDISERSKRYGFKRLPAADRANDIVAAAVQWNHYAGQSAIFIEEDEMVGMEENLQELIKWVIDDNLQRTVISVVGMGGLGKTTLVTKVYNAPLIKHYFECQAWISVSPVHIVENSLRALIKQLLQPEALAGLGNLDYVSSKQLLEILFEHLQHRKYLIILDDMWSIDSWNIVRLAFPNNKLGSRVILTTRNENVPASIGVGSRIYHIEPLSDDDAWSLFVRKSFWSDPEHQCPRELLALAQAIVKKCEGLPLALVSLGGLMSSKNKTVIEWKKVYQSLPWHLENNLILERVKGIFFLSYSDLPFYLKHCFLYCCVFPPGYPIKRKTLIRLWMAEGFIRERKGVTMEEVGEDYLTELILRNMIQVTEATDTTRGKTCRVHDVMRELIMTTSERENFCAVYDGTECDVKGRVSRMSVYNRGEKIRLSTNVLEHLRSFFVFDTGTGSSFSLASLLPKFKFLRVLDLEGIFIETVPNSIGWLFNLRYLNLRETHIKELPKSVDKLLFLQTLDVRSTKLLVLPNGLIKLDNLRHIYMYPGKRHGFGRFDLLSSAVAPKGVWNMRSLQTLTCVEAEEELIQKIGNLTELKRLDITKVKASFGPKLCTSIQMMTGLVRLGLRVVEETEELKLDSIRNAPEYLQKIGLFGRLNQLPPWILSLENLTHLYLGFSQLDEAAFRSLGQLSNLVFFEMHNAYVCTVLHLEPKSYPRLIKLKLMDLQKLDNLIFMENTLPSIREICIALCQNLKKLPGGTEHLTNLRSFQLEALADELIDEFRTELMNKVLNRLSHIQSIKHVSINHGVQTTEILR